MSRLISIAIISIALAGCRGGIPYKPDEWVKCDGVSSPKFNGSGVANAALYVGSLGLLGSQLPEGAKQYYREKGERGVVACTQLLENGIFTSGSYWLRHINILKARAIHYLEIDNGTAALADLETIDVVAGDRVSDIFYQRSLGLSVTFLKGLAYQANKNHKAANLAFQEFADMRPYSKNLQSLALVYLSDDRMKVVNRLVRLDSNYLHIHATLMELEHGKEIEAADNWAYLARGRFYRKSPYQHTKQRNFNDSILVEGNFDPITLGRAAIAAARVNRMEQAYEWIEKAKLNIVGLSKNQENKDDIIQRLRRISSSNNEGKIKYQEILVRAYGQYFAGNIQGARTLLKSESTSFPLWAPVLDLIEKLQQDLPQDQRRGILEFDVKDKWKKLRSESISFQKGDDFLNSLFTKLPSLEMKSKINSYSGKVWFFKENGFSEKTLDDGTHKIEFLGNSSSITIVDEMTLLRAAELAKKASRTGFIIIDLKNYERKRYSTYNGLRVGGDIHAGYITSIRVAFVDSKNIPKKWQTHKGRVFDAEEVWQDLAPIYISSNKRR